MSCPSKAGCRRRAALRAACTTLVLALAAGACHTAPPALTPRTVGGVAGLQHDIDATLDAPALQRTSWGVLVRSLAHDDTLYAHNDRKLMMPASNLKVVTLAAAAERLGWSYTYVTELVATGAIDVGVLDGDLTVVGSGDPTIGGTDPPGSRVLDTWADRLTSLGIHTVRGRIIGDDNAFDDETIGPGWAWDYLADGYATGVSALQYNENIAVVTVAPGRVIGDPAALKIVPDDSGLVFVNRITTAAPNSPGSLHTRRLPGRTQVELTGSVPLDAAASIHTLSVDNPTLFFVSALRDRLVAHGIEVGGPAIDIDDIDDAPARDTGHVLASYRSPPLSTIAGRMMKTSQNLYAETLLKTMGAASGTATAAGGREVARSILQGWGIAANDVVMVDGSGLSRYNLVTPAALVAILTRVDRDDRLRQPFEASLPVAGRDGTLAGRLKGTAAEGNVRAKSGSIANVRALSGYVRSADGEPLVFSLLANNFETTPDVIDQAIDAIVVRLAQWSRK